MKIFNQVKRELRNYDILDVAEQAGVHYTTLYHWLDGRTKTPHLRTFLKVAIVLGYEIQLARIQGQLRIAA